MLDTIKLLLSKDMFWVTDKTYFSKKKLKCLAGLIYISTYNRQKQELINAVYNTKD